MSQSRIFIVASAFAYVASSVSIFFLGTEFYWERTRLILMIAYLPFLVTASWAGYLAYRHLARTFFEVKENLIIFGVNSVVFLGWLGVLLVQFSVFAPHA